MRVFVGLPWPKDLRQDLESRASGWQNRPNLRMVIPDNWHVTLQFLGDVPTSRLVDLENIVSSWALHHHALTFVEKGWGVFGPARDPRVVLLRLEALPAVARAVVSLQKSLVSEGFRGEDKIWKPHVTLGYGKGGSFGDWPEDRVGPRPPIIFDRAVIYESVLGPVGSTYTERSSSSLAPESAG